VVSEDGVTVGALVADTLARAIARGVFEAATLGAIPGYSDQFAR
jgi:L-aminopeptidase/D-esterase-like protein